MLFRSCRIEVSDEGSSRQISPDAAVHRERQWPAVRVEQFGFPTSGQQPPVLEEYHYSNIKTNVGLSDIDFDAANKAYGF